MKTTCRPPKRPTRNQNHNPLFFCIFLYALVREIRQKTNQNRIKPRSDVLMTPNSFALPVRTPQSLVRGMGGGGEVGKAPPQGPTPYPFIYHFCHKRGIFLLTNGIFHIPSLEFCILLSAVLNMNESQTRTFSRLFHSHKMHLLALEKRYPFREKPTSIGHSRTYQTRICYALVEVPIVMICLSGTPRRIKLTFSFARCKMQTKAMDTDKFLDMFLESLPGSLSYSSLNEQICETPLSSFSFLCWSTGTFSCKKSKAFSGKRGCMHRNCCTVCLGV